MYNKCKIKELKIFSSILFYCSQFLSHLKIFKWFIYLFISKLYIILLAVTLHYLYCWKKTLTDLTTLTLLTWWICFNFIGFFAKTRRCFPPYDWNWYYSVLLLLLRLLLMLKYSSLISHTPLSLSTQRIKWLPAYQLAELHAFRCAAVRSSAFCSPDNTLNISCF